MKRWQKIGLVAAAVIVPALSCGQRSLVLIDVRASSDFTNPTVLLGVGMSLTANDDVTTRFSNVRLRTDGAFQIGMYLPSDMNGTVTFKASVDNGHCTLGMGTTSVTGVQSGETTKPIDLIIIPTPECTPITDGGAGMTGTAGTGGVTGAG
ncbi:MAG TPA: hypothetical protein VN903_09375, partial [Polyangia bacterium]|nr:hypothetical protein [Polyangia bacterium]